MLRGFAVAVKGFLNLYDLEIEWMVRPDERIVPKEAVTKSIEFHYMAPSRLYVDSARFGLNPHGKLGKNECDKNGIDFAELWPWS